MSDSIPPSPLSRVFSEDVLSQSSLSDQDWLDIASADSESNRSESDSDDDQDHQSEIDSAVESVDGSWDGSSTDEGPENDTDIEQDSDFPASDLASNEPICVKDVISVGNSEELITTDAVNDSQVSEALAQSLSPTLELSERYRSLTLSAQPDALATVRRRRIHSSNSQTPVFHSAVNSIQLTFPDPLTTSDPSTRRHSLARTESAISQDPARETSFGSTIPETLPDTVSLPDSLSSIDFESQRLPLAPSSASPLRHALQIIVLGSPASSLYHKVHLMEYVLRGASRAVCPGGMHKEILTQETLCARSRAYAIEAPDATGKPNSPSILVLDCTGRSLEVLDMAPEGTPTVAVFLLTSACLQGSNLMSVLNVPRVAKFLPVSLPSIPKGDEAQTLALSSSPSLWIDVPGMENGASSAAVTGMRDAQLMWDGVGQDKSLLLESTTSDDIRTIAELSTADYQARMESAIGGLLGRAVPIQRSESSPTVKPVMLDQHSLVRLVPYLNTTQGRTLSFALSFLALFVGSIAFHSMNLPSSRASPAPDSDSPIIVPSRTLWDTLFAPSNRSAIDIGLNAPVPSSNTLSLASTSLRDFAISVFNPTEVSESLSTIAQPRRLKRKRASTSETGLPCAPKVVFVGDVYPPASPIRASPTEPWGSRARTPTIQGAPQPLTIDYVAKLTLNAPTMPTTLNTIPRSYSNVMEMTNSVTRMLKQDLNALVQALDEWLVSLRAQLEVVTRRLPFSHRRAKRNAKKIRDASGRFFARVGEEAKKNGEAFSATIEAVKVGIAEGFKQKVAIRDTLRKKKDAWRTKKRSMLTQQGKRREDQRRKKERSFEVFHGYVI